MKAQRLIDCVGLEGQWEAAGIRGVPPTADIIAKLSHGLADDVLTCTVLASDAPLLIAPAMNEKMFYNKFTQENIKRLESNGTKIIPPIQGHLVCMDQGMGHIAENASILKAVRNLLK